MNISIYPSPPLLIHPAFHPLPILPPTCPSFSSLISPVIHSSFYPFPLSSIHPPLFMHPSIVPDHDLSFCPSTPLHNLQFFFNLIHLSIHPSTHLPLYPSIILHLDHPSTLPSIVSSLFLSFSLFIHPYNPFHPCTSIHPSMLLSFSTLIH